MLTFTKKENYSIRMECTKMAKYSITIERREYNFCYLYLYNFLYNYEFALTMRTDLIRVRGRK